MAYRGRLGYLYIGWEFIHDRNFMQ
jgi:hypothetical protein